MTPTQQNAEIAKADVFSAEQKRILRRNKAQLMKGKPHPIPNKRISCGLSRRQLEKMDRRLFESAKARSSSSSSRAIAQSILSRPQTTVNSRSCDVCQVCGYVPTPAMIASLKYDLKTGECAQCKEAQKQIIKCEYKNNLLNLVDMEGRNSEAGFYNSMFSTTISAKSFLQTQLGDDHAALIAPLLPKDELSVKVLEATEYKFAENHRQISKEIAGAHWHMPHGSHPNTVMLDSSYDVTLVLLPFRRGYGPDQQRNFVMLLNSHMQQSIVDSFSANEHAKSISHNKLGHRPGPAAGVCRLQDRTKCKSFSKVTNKATTLLLASGKHGCNMKAMYYNDNNEIKHTTYGYPSIKMNRLEKSGKLKEAKHCESYRHVLLKEAIGYIFALAGLSKLNILEACELSNLREILGRSHNTTTIEQILIQWMCTKGEMRNHQAVACHCDGNNSQSLEIYSVFNRVGLPKKDAFIFLPLDNILLQLKCGQHMMICNLTHTPHVPDQSRNTHNFSKVHGPCP